MKGVTPVIAVILLLLITLSMVSFAFIWFQRVTQTTTSNTDQQLQTELSRQGEKIKIEGASGTTITLRNTGGITLPAASVALFVNGSLSTSGDCPAAPVAAAFLFTCDTFISACSGTSTVRASAPGNIDEVLC